MTLPSPLPRQSPVRVMVVDDSAVVRGFIVRMLESEPAIEVVATCSNGQIAIQQASRRELDVIILDVEMPVMDGITALPKLLAACPSARIIVASTLTQRNAAISLEALARGATDYIPKPSAKDLHSADDFRRSIVEKVLALGASRAARVVPQPREAIAPRSVYVLPPRIPSHARKAPQIIAIASSTGGPQALMELLRGLAPSVSCPIVIAQHMPRTFTAILAEHLARASGRPCREAVNGGPVEPGTIHLAPGDFHLQVERSGGGCRSILTQTAPENFCRPSADPLFRSVAREYGAACCAVVLTGMGSDGSNGARAIAEAGGTIVAQDEATSVVWGMPGAVAKADIGATILPLPHISAHLKHLFQGGQQ